ncbi:MAG TPA: response regulator [Puia sp.]|jgi:two-component system cell cycle response regulator DivK
MENRKKILIVDDDPDHLLICNLLFRRRGYDVLPLLGCDPFEELTDAIDSFQPSLIFMDHFMPGVSGLDAIKMLKADPKYRSIPIIYFSIHNDLARIALEAGADGHFQKPFQIDELIKIADKYAA